MVYPGFRMTIHLLFQLLQYAAYPANSGSIRVHFCHQLALVFIRTLSALLILKRHQVINHKVNFQTKLSAMDTPVMPQSGREKPRGLSISRYIITRFTSLKPVRKTAPNPFKLAAQLTFQQWMFFLVAFFGWTWDAFDFFTVSLTVSDLAETFDKTNAQITWGITLVLMLRSVGAISFGIVADRYGRKW